MLALDAEEALRGMSWNRGEKIAAWTLAATIASCPLIYPYLDDIVPGLADIFEKDESPESSSPENDATDLENAQKELAAAQKRKLEEEAAAMREQAQHLHAERMKTRDERVDRIAKSLKEDGGSKLYSIRLDNDCGHSKISVAIGYKDLIGDWVSKGWWVLEPDAEVLTSVVTNNRVVYFFATAAGVPEAKYSWNGVGKEGSASFYIYHNKKFHLLDKESYPFLDAKQKDLFKKEIPAGSKEYRQAFACGNWEEAVGS